MKKLFMLLCLSMVMMGAGCQDTFLNNSTNTLMTTKASWENLQVTVAQAKIDGVITDAQWKQFVSIDKKFRATQNACVEVLKVYAEAKKSGNESGAQIAANTVTATLNNLMGILTEGQTLFQAWKG